MGAILTIDRFAGDLAVIEVVRDNNVFTITIPRLILPSDAQEGDVFSIIKNQAEKTQRENNINKLMNDVWKD